LVTWETAGLIVFHRFLTQRESNAMTSTNEYSRFAVASLNSTESATDLSDKFGLLILTDAWLDLAEQTTQTMDHEADEAHSMMEQPLKRASVQGHWD
jgi:hypothetical protein